MDELLAEFETNVEGILHSQDPEERKFCNAWLLNFGQCEEVPEIVNYLLLNNCKNCLLVFGAVALRQNIRMHISDLSYISEMLVQNIINYLNSDESATKLYYDCLADYVIYRNDILSFIELCNQKNKIELLQILAYELSACYTQNSFSREQLEHEKECLKNIIFDIIISAYQTIENVDSNYFKLLTIAFDLSNGIREIGPFVQVIHEVYELYPCFVDDIINFLFFVFKMNIDYCDDDEIEICDSLVTIAVDLANCKIDTCEEEDDVVEKNIDQAVEIWRKILDFLSKNLFSDDFCRFVPELLSFIEKIECFGLYTWDLISNLCDILDLAHETLPESDFEELPIQTLIYLINLSDALEKYSMLNEISALSNAMGPSINEFYLMESTLESISPGLIAAIALTPNVSSDVIGIYSSLILEYEPFSLPHLQFAQRIVSKHPELFEQWAPKLNESFQFDTFKTVLVLNDIISCQQTYVGFLTSEHISHVIEVAKSTGEIDEITVYIVFLSSLASILNDDVALEISENIIEISHQLIASLLNQEIPYFDHFCNFVAKTTEAAKSPILRKALLELLIPLIDNLSEMATGTDAKYICALFISLVNIGASPIDAINFAVSNFLETNNPIYLNILNALGKSITPEFVPMIADIVTPFEEFLDSEEPISDEMAKPIVSLLMLSHKLGTIKNPVRWDIIPPVFVARAAAREEYYIVDAALFAMQFLDGLCGEDIRLFMSTLIDGILNQYDVELIRMAAQIVGVIGKLFEEPQRIEMAESIARNAPQGEVIAPILHGCFCGFESKEEFDASVSELLVWRETPTV